MKITGGCYCKKIRYEAEGEPLMRGLCHCRECQYISGGGANVALAMPLSGFRYTAGQPKSYSRSDLETPVKREFCPDCGTSLASLPPGLPDGMPDQAVSFGLGANDEMCFLWAHYY